MSNNVQGYGGRRMKAYYVMFYNDDKKLCGIWRRAEDKEEACLMAEFALIARFPNVVYTSCEVINEAD